jgi:hypothetical protein
MDIVTALKHALLADHVVLGGGNAKRLKRLPKDIRLGDNAHAFAGGFRIWEQAWKDERAACVVHHGR